MKTLLTLFVLLFSSSVFAEVPTSLFGISLNEPVKNYLKLDVDTSFTDHSYFDGIVEFGFYEDQINNLIPNSRFEKYWISADKKELVNKIVGFKTKVDVIDTEECLKDAVSLKSLLSSYYKLNPLSFDSNYYKYYWKDINDYKYKPIAEVKKRVVYTWITKVVKGNIDGESYVLSFSCRFSKNDKNQIVSDLLITLENLSKNEEFHINFKSEKLSQEEFTKEFNFLKEDLSGF